MNNSNTIKPTGSETHEKYSALKKSQVLFIFEGLHDVLQQGVGENHKVLCWLSR